MLENMLNHPNIKLMLNSDFKEICELHDNEFYFMEQKFEGRVIYTGAIDELFEYKFGDLPYRSVNMQFETVEKEYYQNVATVNYPNEYNFTRITEFKHIHHANTKKTTILKEYPQAYIKGKNTPYYPIFTDENQKNYNKYLDYSQTVKNLVLVGRLAEYKYYDMDDMVERALDVFKNNILEGKDSE